MRIGPSSRFTSASAFSAFADMRKLVLAHIHLDGVDANSDFLSPDILRYRPYFRTVPDPGPSEHREQRLGRGRR